MTPYCVKVIDSVGPAGPVGVLHGEHPDAIDRLYPVECDFCRIQVAAGRNVVPPAAVGPIDPLSVPIVQRGCGISRGVLRGDIRCTAVGGKCCVDVPSGAGVLTGVGSGVVLFAMVALPLEMLIMPFTTLLRTILKVSLSSSSRSSAVTCTSTVFTVSSGANVSVSLVDA